MIVDAQKNRAEILHLLGNGIVHRFGQFSDKPGDADDKLEGNPWASMPSDHVASAAITAMGLAEIGPLYGALGWTYVAMASFSIVKSSTHYWKRRCSSSDGDGSTTRFARTAPWVTGPPHRRRPSPVRSLRLRLSKRTGLV